MRDFLVVGLIVASLPIGLIRPYYAMLTYTWLSYMYPHMLTSGFAQTFPGAKLTALSTLAGTFITRSANIAALRQRENVIMIFLWCIFTFSTLFAVNPDDAWVQWQDASKLILMALLTSMLLHDHKRVRLFLLVVALSLGFYGFKGGIFSIVTGGQHMVYGPGTSMIAANNSIGLALNMCLPILWYLAYEESRYLKIGLRIIFFLSIPAILFTYSRASALTCPIVLLTIMFKGRSRTLLAVSMLLIVIVALPFVPSRWVNRQQSTLTYEADQSAMSRIDTWRVVWRVALDHPLTGAGFGFNTRKTFDIYGPEFRAVYGAWASPNTHSIYMSMLGSHGFPGLFVFVVMIACCFLACQRMQRSVRRHSKLDWISSYCSMIQISLLAFLINGAFVNMEYFDLVYHWVGVVASLRVICNQALSETEAEEPSLTPELVTATS
jgi:probable O-glycosylation ligase (exosortase A-associated)